MDAFGNSSSVSIHGARKGRGSTTESDVDQENDRFSRDGSADREVTRFPGDRNSLLLSAYPDRRIRRMIRGFHTRPCPESEMACTVSRFAE